MSTMILPNLEALDWGHMTVKQSQAMNRKFQDLVTAGPTGLHKLSEIHADQLESYLRETTVLDKVLPPEDITPADCEVGPTHDTLYKRIYMQLETRAFLSSFEALPRQVQEVYIPRIFLAFFMLSTPQYVLNDYNIQAYPFPVAKQIEDNIGLDMHEAKDWVMLDRLEAAIQASRGTYDNVIRGVQAQADIDVAGTNTEFRGQLEREDLIAMKKFFAGTRTRINAVIIPETNYLDLERFDVTDFGDNMVERVFRDGLEQDRVHGVQIIRTIKIDQERGDVFREGNIYGFAPPRQIGRNYTLRGLKFYVDRDHQYLYFDAQMAAGFVWAVASRVCKLELYNGGVDTTGTLVGAPGDPVPSSDLLFGAPEDVTAKDYFDVNLEFRRPLIRFTGS